MGWDAYFGTLFERLDGTMLKEHKAKYQGAFTHLFVGIRADIQDLRKRNKT